MVAIEKVERYLRPLRNYARDEIRAYEALGALPRGELSAEDVADLALVDAIRHHATEPRRLYTTLRTLVRRAVEREVKRRRAERSLFEPVGIGRPDDDGSSTPRRLLDVLPDPTSPIPDEVVESREFQQVLVALLRQLPTDWREPFILHIRERLPLDDVARMEDVPVAEVRHRIDMAREFLRAKLADEYQDSAVSPPTDAIFEFLDSVEPAPDHLARARSQPEAPI